MIPYQVCRNLHEPSSDAGRAPKLAAPVIGPHKAVLRQILGYFPVAQRGQDEPEDSRPKAAARHVVPWSRSDKFRETQEEAIGSRGRTSALRQAK